MTAVLVEDPVAVAVPFLRVGDSILIPKGSRCRLEGAWRVLGVRQVRNEGGNSFWIAELQAEAGSNVFAWIGGGMMDCVHLRLPSRNV